MENASQDQNTDKQITILKFMEITECQTYEEAKFFVSMENYNLKHAVSAFINSKGNSEPTPQLTNSNLSNNQSTTPQRMPRQQLQQGFSLSPEQTKILQRRLRQRLFSSNKSQHLSPIQHNNLQQQTQGICSRTFKSCKNSLKCFTKIKTKLKRKINSFKNVSDKIYYFQELYQNQLQNAGFQPQNDIIQSFQLTNIEDNQKIKIIQNKSAKPIFALIVPNRKSQLICNLLKNTQLMTFIRQNFEPIFITLSELRELSLERRHCLKRIRKCPTAIGYLKNAYDLEDKLVEFEGENIKEISIESLKQGLEKVNLLSHKWKYLLNLEEQLRQKSITSLNQVIDEDYDQFDDYKSSPSTRYAIGQNEQNPQSKRSLIQQQTKIYQQLVEEQAKRKKSVELERLKLQQLKELRQIRKMSLPEEPTLQHSALIIEFKFRCPLGGEFIIRRFLKDQKVDILYQFVDTSEQIQFETEPERNFDLFTSFPPTSLSTKKQQLLKDVFDQQKQNILIREI